uniref:Selenoprotein H n=1 Tax=Cebus imitator TaxID=2715852 RepID=A0A2K5RL25_CEBIM
MASRGRKRKAEAAVVATTEKREKLANGGEGVEEATIVIEHCTSRVYGRNAAALSQALRLEAPELPVKVNPAKPRRGSFEVTLLRPDGSSAELWTGIKKGPPRKLKFPEPQEVVEELKKYLS